MKNYIVKKSFHDYIIGYIVIKYKDFAINKPYCPNYFQSFFFSSNKDLVLLQINKFATLLLDNYTIHHIVSEPFIESCRNIDFYNLLCISGDTFIFTPSPIRINNKKYSITFTWKLDYDVYRIESISSELLFNQRD